MEGVRAVRTRQDLALLINQYGDLSVVKVEENPEPMDTDAGDEVLLCEEEEEEVGYEVDKLSDEEAMKFLNSDFHGNSWSLESSGSGVSECGEEGERGEGGGRSCWMKRRRGKRSRERSRA
jgi:hypothetical protein